jgi:hypothetical protein
MSEPRSSTDPRSLLPITTSTGGAPGEGHARLLESLSPVNGKLVLVLDFIIVGGGTLICARLDRMKEF